MMPTSTQFEQFDWHSNLGVQDEPKYNYVITLELTLKVVQLTVYL